MSFGDVVFHLLLVLVVGIVTTVVESWAMTAGGRRDPIEGSLELAYRRSIVVGPPAFLFAVGLSFVLYPLVFGWIYALNLCMYLGVGGFAIVTSVLFYGELRNSRVRLDPKGLSDRKQPAIRWDEIVKVRINEENDLELHTVDGRKVIVHRWYEGFNDAIPLFLAYLPEPARTQFGELLVRN